MASRIQEYLNKIKTAIYGRDVREAIHNSIYECYSDVSSAKTIADGASEYARSMGDTAAINANLAAQKAAEANASAQSAATATTNANTARDEAIAAASNANTKAQLADEATNSANIAKDEANSASEMAKEAATQCNRAVEELPDQIQKIFDGYGLAFTDGKLCVKVERV